MSYNRFLSKRNVRLSCVENSYIFVMASAFTGQASTQYPQNTHLVMSM